MSLKGGRTCALALLAALLVAAPAAQASAGLEYKGAQQLSPRLQELTFSTPALAGDTKVRVLLPAGYDPSGRTRYPVLYLLNGATDNQASWTTKGDAERITAGYPLIVVMPDGGAYGNYVDWYNGGNGGPPKWETYHLRQLLPWIDAHFTTVGRRSGRAIAGLSMGGGGTMHYASAHPDLFAAAASFSGAVDTNNLFVQPLTETSGIGDLVPPGSVYGHRATDEVRWRGHNPWDLAENLRGLYLEVVTGNGNPGGPGGDTGDPVESGVHQQSTSFHDRLAALGIPHLWNDYGAGGHAWYYWNRDLTQILPRLMEVYRHPARLPVPFDYASISPDYAVYGWSVRITRPAIEFSHLNGAGPRGFTLRGSGRALVRTARYYRPGARLAVTLTDGARVERVVRRAGSRGRLSLPLVLGPANPFQEYSPQGREWMASRSLSNDSGRVADESQGWPVYSTTVSVRPLKRRAHR